VRGRLLPCPTSVGMSSRRPCRCGEPGWFRRRVRYRRFLHPKPTRLPTSCIFTSALRESPGGDVGRAHYSRATGQSAHKRPERPATYPRLTPLTPDFGRIRKIMGTSAYSASAQEGLSATFGDHTDLKGVVTCGADDVERLGHGRLRHDRDHADPQVADVGHL